jgi:hypothetical protein
MAQHASIERFETVYHLSAALRIGQRQNPNATFNTVMGTEIDMASWYFQATRALRSDWLVPKSDSSKAPRCVPRFGRYPQAPGATEEYQP